MLIEQDKDMNSEKPKSSRAIGSDAVNCIQSLPAHGLMGSYKENPGNS